MYKKLMLTLISMFVVGDPDNDDQNLRLVTAKLLIGLLEIEDQIAVVRFSTSANSWWT